MTVTLGRRSWNLASFAGSDWILHYLRSMRSLSSRRLPPMACPLVLPGSAVVLNAPKQCVTGRGIRAGWLVIFSRRSRTDGRRHPTQRCPMRAFSIRTALCLTLVTLATTTAFAGVRGKPTKLKEPVPAGRRIAQGESEYTGVNSHPVPVPADANVTNETILRETTIAPSVRTSDPNAFTTATVARPNTMMPPMCEMPMMAPTMQPMPMMPMSGCSTCGGYGHWGGLSPGEAALYDQAFGPGLYRSGAEAGGYQFPYYSYRRPWYFPGQPSFQRSTDYVW